MDFSKLRSEKKEFLHMKRRLTLGLAIPVTVGLVALGVILHSPTSHTLAASSTPPPPPSLIPTPITPPPPPPTLTPTAAPSPTATTAPLGANVRLVASASLTHKGKTALLHWRMAFQRGVKGFRIYAGKTQLTKSLIRTHKSANYTAKVRWVKGSMYSLKILFKNGQSQMHGVH